VFVAATDEKAPIVAKVGDFGEARISFSYSKRDNVANPVWLAPELLRGGNYTKAADVYSFVVRVSLLRMSCDSQMPCFLLQCWYNFVGDRLPRAPISGVS
jgi:hypothetical protein